MPAKRYRKLPVEIEAIQFTGDNSDEVVQWGVDEIESGEWNLNGIGSPLKWTNWVRCLAIYTLEGEMLALPGDYIIRGVAGELYPCKEEIFQQTYEEVE